MNDAKYFPTQKIIVIRSEIKTEMVWPVPLTQFEPIQLRPNDQVSEKIQESLNKLISHSIISAYIELQTLDPFLDGVSEIYRVLSAEKKVQRRHIPRFAIFSFSTDPQNSAAERIRKRFTESLTDIDRGGNEKNLKFFRSFIHLRQSIRMRQITSS
eukprot:TRINITY_DN6718_c0_g1_i1.p1 TRINITY_DN6718_c0_g1~~TRINITY_DN6718_c0_g1_i1.p1  ORF type:complete len:156 (-),score=16.30 TRINITY_DN6718_c0_g1_i1:353-820(-)